MNTKLFGSGLLSKVIVCGAVLTTATPAFAQTLQEILLTTVNNSPNLKAFEQGVKVLEERRTQANRATNPTFGLEFSGGVSHARAENGNTMSNNPLTASVIANQPLWTGGRGDSAIDQAERTIEQGESELFATRQDILLQAITAYMNVVRDKEVVELNKNNVTVLEEQHRAVKVRFGVGDVTKTDLAQAEARLSGAKAELIVAEGTLKASEAEFKQIVGTLPVDLKFPSGMPLKPKGLNEALSIGYEKNPQLVAAIKATQVAEAGIDRAESELYPSLSLKGTASYVDQTSRTNVSVSEGVATLNLNVPLFQNGAEYSRIQEAELVQGRRRLERDQAERQVEQDVIQAWAELEATDSSLQANKEQVKANQIALDGVRKEHTVGVRTVLDILDAEQELLNSKVTVIKAERNQIVAAYKLQQAMGIDLLSLAGS